jgi:hypothetical protein
MEDERRVNVTLGRILVLFGKKPIKNYRRCREFPRQRHLKKQTPVAEDPLPV